MHAAWFEVLRFIARDFSASLFADLARHMQDLNGTLVHPDPIMRFDPEYGVDYEDNLRAYVSICEGVLLTLYVKQEPFIAESNVTHSQAKPWRWVWPF